MTAVSGYERDRCTTFREGTWAYVQPLGWVKKPHNRHLCPNCASDTKPKGQVA